MLKHQITASSKAFVVGYELTVTFLEDIHPEPSDLEKIKEALKLLDTMIDKYTQSQPDPDEIPF